MKNRTKKEWGKILLPILIMIILLCVSEAFARAGGAGGSSGGSGRSYGGGSGGSGGGDGGEAVYFLIRILFLIPFPFNIIVIVIILGIGYHIFKNGDFLQGASFLDEYNSDFHEPKKNNIELIKKSNPQFNEQQFLKNVETAFYAIQDAWNKKDLKEVRRFISDGVWQRFNTQFLMMDQLKQVNRLENIYLENKFIDLCEQDGEFDVIHVGIKASLNDYFECELDSSLNSGGHESFIEYWSFIKKRDSQEKDLYETTNCPSCGGALDDGLGEVAKCPYCNAIVNSGEYDWVLSEITQSDDYAKGNRLQKAENLSVKRKQLAEENDDFSLQQIEDHASNGMMQILAAKALHEPARIKRFVSNELFATLESEIKSFTYLFNRLYINDVSVIAAEKVDGFNRLYISITYTSQRVEVEQGGLYYADPILASETHIARIIRKADAQKGKGALYMHECSSCGAHVDDSLDTTCPYCGSMLNSGDTEWIFDALFSNSEYYAYIMEHKKRFSFAIKQKRLDSLLSVKEFAIQNVMAVIAADGKITEEEEQFLDEFASKLKFKKSEKESIIALAKQNRLQLTLPEDQSAREKIYALMQDAAEADGVVQPQEKMILDYVKKIVYPG